MIVISDTSPISNLILIDKLEILQQVYGKVVIPQVVLDELLVLQRFGYDLAKFKTSEWITIQNPSDTHRVEMLAIQLDAGESAAIALALELQPSCLVIDEKKGRRIAAELDVEIIGLIGILIEAKELKLIHSVKQVLDELILKANFRISPQLYHTILEKLNEL